jgi:hypothetical protein
MRLFLLPFGNPINRLQKYDKNRLERKKMKNFRKNVWRIEKCCIFAAANEGH